MKNSGDITKTELYSLVKANVPDEDVNEVTLYARGHDITVTDALKTDEVKALLKTRGEKRKSAELASTGSFRRSSSKVSDAELLEKVEKGGMVPEEEIDRLIDARMEAKKNRN